MRISTPSWSNPYPAWNPKSRLIVIPDGKLHLLPFSSLRGPQGRYLLGSHIVSYASSATILCLIRNSLTAKPPTRRSCASAMFNTRNIGQHRPRKTRVPTRLQPLLPLTPSTWSVVGSEVCPILVTKSLLPVRCSEKRGSCWEQTPLKRLSKPNHWPILRSFTLHAWDCER